MPVQAPPADLLAHGVVSPTARWPQSKSYCSGWHIITWGSEQMYKLEGVNIKVVVAKGCLHGETYVDAMWWIIIVIESVRESWIQDGVDFKNASSWALLFWKRGVGLHDSHGCGGSSKLSPMVKSLSTSKLDTLLPTQHTKQGHWEVEMFSPMNQIRIELYFQQGSM